ARKCRARPSTVTAATVAGPAETPRSLEPTAWLLLACRPMSGIQGEAAAPAAPGRWPRSSRVVETALAFAALFGLAVGVYLGHQVVGMFGASVIESQVRAQHRQRSW